MKLSNEQLIKMRKNHRNGLHLACTLLSDKIGMTLIRVMLHMWSPCRAHFGKAMKASATRRGQIELDRSIVCGANDDVMFQTLAVLRSRDAITKMRFLEGPVEANLCEADIADADGIAQKAYRLALHVLGTRVPLLLVFTDARAIAAVKRGDSKKPKHLQRTHRVSIGAVHVPSLENRADVLTKAMMSAAFM